MDRRNKFIVILLLIISPFILFCEDKKNLVIVKNRNITAYTDVIKGVRDTMKHNNMNIRIIVLKYDKKNIVQNIKNSNAGVILTIGSEVTTFIADAVPEIPLVFSMIVDPYGDYLKRDRIWGVSLDIPIWVQFDTLKAVIPNLNRVGVLHHNVENQKIVAQAKVSAKEMGFSLKSIFIKTISQIPDISEMNIEALWIIPDTVICKPTIIKHLLLSGIKNRIPVYGISSQYARAGALVAMSCDYRDIGRQAGEIVVDIFKNKKSESNKIERPRKYKLYFNKTVAKRLRIKIPEKLLLKADKVFGNED